MLAATIAVEAVFVPSLARSIDRQLPLTSAEAGPISPAPRNRPLPAYEVGALFDIVSLWKGCADGGAIGAVC